jgi:hypothetical protein
LRALSRLIAVGDWTDAETDVATDAALDALTQVSAAASAILYAEMSLSLGLRTASGWVGGSHLDDPPEASPSPGSPWSDAPLGLSNAAAHHSRLELASKYRVERVRGIRAAAQVCASGLAQLFGKAPKILTRRITCLWPRVFPVIGLEMQAPWCDMLLSGTKTIETRDYALPAALLGAPIALLRSPPPHGLSVAGLDKAKLAGVVIFSHSRRYLDFSEWAADSQRHRVAAEAPPEAFGWSGIRFGWTIAGVCRGGGEGCTALGQCDTASLPSVALQETGRLLRSIFVLPFARSLFGPLTGLIAGLGRDDDVIVAPFDLSEGSAPKMALVHRRRNAQTMGGHTDDTGLHSWPATRGLAEALSAPLVRSALLGPTARVVELGAGCGTLAALAAACGVSRSLATDAAPAALRLAARNVAAAAAPGAARSGALRLMWGDALDAQSARRFLCGPPSLVLASECLYEHRDEGGGGVATRAAALCSCIASLLKPAEGAGLALLVYSPRYPKMAEALGVAARAAGLALVALKLLPLLPAEARTRLPSDARLAAAGLCEAALLRATSSSGLGEATLWDAALQQGAMAWEGYAEVDEQEIARVENDLFAD